MFKFHNFMQFGSFLHKNAYISTSNWWIEVLSAVLTLVHHCKSLRRLTRKSKILKFYDLWPFFSQKCPYLNNQLTDWSAVSCANLSSHWGDLQGILKKILKMFECLKLLTFAPKISTPVQSYEGGILGPPPKNNVWVPYNNIPVQKVQFCKLDFGPTFSVN